MATKDSKKLSPVAKRFAQLVDSSDMSRNEIADKIGFSNANNVTMMKQGLTKIPKARAARIARVFNIDPAEFMKQVWSQYDSVEYDAIVGCLGEPVSKGERKLLEALHGVFTEEDIKLKTRECCDKIKESLGAA